MKKSNMKLFKILILALLSTLGSLSAQSEDNNKENETDNREKMRFGAKIGVNGSNVMTTKEIRLQPIQNMVL
jgi:hypothetical protein